MSRDDDPYTLSPESIFVKAPPKTLSTRIEEFYLGLLRAFILLVLALSLLGALVLSYLGYSAMNGEPKLYNQPRQATIGDRFLAQLRTDSATAATLAASGPTPSGDVRGSAGASQALDAQWNRQMAVINEFLGVYARSITNPALYKERQRNLGAELATSGSDTELVSYARNQADFLERVLKDKATIDLVHQKQEQSPAYLEEFLNKVLDFYPQQVRDDHRARASFERDEDARLAAVRAKSATQLYIALGLFGAFLVVSLVLVLIKIERNLRIRGEVIQVIN